MVFSVAQSSWLTCVTYFLHSAFLLFQAMANQFCALGIFLTCDRVLYPNCGAHSCRVILPLTPCLQILKWRMLSVLGLQNIYAAPTIHKKLSPLCIDILLSKRYRVWKVMYLINWGENREDELYISRSDQISWFIAFVPESSLISTLFQKPPGLYAKLYGHPRFRQGNHIPVCLGQSCLTLLTLTGW